MEASGLGGTTATVVLLPGLLAAGIGALVFIGLDSLTGLGTFSLALPSLPVFVRPDVAEFGWAFVIGLGASLLAGYAGTIAGAASRAPEFGWNRNIPEVLDADAGRGAGSDRDSYIMPSVFGSQIDSAGQ